MISFVLFVGLNIYFTLSKCAIEQTCALKVNLSNKMKTNESYPARDNVIIKEPVCEYTCVECIKLGA